MLHDCMTGSRHQIYDSDTVFLWYLAGMNGAQTYGCMLCNAFTLFWLHRKPQMQHSDMTEGEAAGS